ncbi:hypothetical protein C0L75_03140 [Clostridium perfringens]
MSNEIKKTKAKTGRPGPGKERVYITYDSQVIKKLRELAKKENKNISAFLQEIYEPIHTKLGIM